MATNTQGPKRAGSGRPAIDWQKAFLYYVGLSPERRTYGAVASRFGVSGRTVERHGLNEHWQARARTIDAQALAEAAEEVGRQRADQLADVQKLIEASFMSYAQQLRDGRVRLSASDLPRLVKLLQELWGENEPAQPLPERPAPPAVASFEHMRDVLRTLHESGAFDSEQKRTDDPGRAS